MNYEVRCPLARCRRLLGHVTDPGYGWAKFTPTKAADCLYDPSDHKGLWVGCSKHDRMPPTFVALR